MIRNLKVLGLMAVAAFAMSAMFASSASATTGTGMFTCGIKASNTHTPCVIHGEQTGAVNFFEAGGSKTECENQGVTFTANATGTDKDITVTPHYKDCRAEGLPATVNMNGCTYTFTQPTTNGSHYDGTVDLVCPAGQSVDIEVFLFGTPTGSHTVNVCTVRVFPKNNLTNTTYTAGTKGGKADVTIDTNITNVSWTKTGSCATNGHEEGVNGQYVSTVTVTGKNAEGTADDVWISD